MANQCRNCGENIPASIVVDDKKRNLQNRKYCLQCSPFGEHNTKQIHRISNTTKTCARCKEEKSFDQFNTKGKTNRLLSYCKSCFNAYCVERWQKRKIEAIKQKGGGCSICGYNKNYAALEFHHRNGSTKEFQWNKLRTRKQVDIDKELAKCDLVCRNCHAELHNPQGVLE